MGRIENGINNYLYGADGAMFIRDDFAPAEVAYSDHINSSIRKQGSDVLFFNANRAIADGSSVNPNPISGHAAGDDIHPYSIRFLPILIY